MDPRGTETPAAAALVAAFVNTYDVYSGTDVFSGAEELAAWLREQRLLDGSSSLDESDVERALEVREALREVLVASDGEPPDGAAVAALDRAAEAARLVLRFRDDGTPVLEPDAAGADAALGRILAAVHAAMAEGSWDRLKACRRDDCRWAFYDHSKNQSKKWCSMGVCGNRAKAQRFRTRHSHSTPSS